MPRTPGASRSDTTPPLPSTPGARRYDTTNQALEIHLFKRLKGREHGCSDTLPATGTPCFRPVGPCAPLRHTPGSGRGGRNSTSPCHTKTSSPSLPSNAVPQSRKILTACGFPCSVLAGRTRQDRPASGDHLALSTLQPCLVSVVCTKANYKSRKIEYKSQKRTANKFRENTPNGEKFCRGADLPGKKAKKKPRRRARSHWGEKGREGESGSRKGRNLLKSRPIFPFLKGRKSARTTSPARARSSKGRWKTLAAPWPHRKSWRSSDSSANLRARKRHSTSGTPPRPLAFSFPQKNHLEVTSLHAQTTRPTIQRSQSP